MKVNYSLKSLLFITLSFLYSYAGLTQIPAGYYDAAEGKNGYELKTELFFIIDNHNDRGYNALWELYPIADKRADGFLWDIYSNCDLTFGTDQDNGSGGTSFCEKYNREHTFPQSWFNSASTPRADAHMVLPTDKKMNSERGNFPYGETNGSEISIENGNGAKKGSNILSGYSGTVFEPADQYKGDIARIYFYMATRYESDIDAWETNSSESDVVLNGTENQVFENWVLAMLLNWHQNDPVSQKEIDRNNAVYNHQGNRNPFVDHPEWVSCIWQNGCGNNPTPKLETNVSSLNYGTFAFGNSTSIKSFTLSGTDLTSSISLNSNSEDFLISTSQNSGFNTELTLNPDADGKLTQTIFVALNPMDNINETLSASINVRQAETDDLNITLSASIIQTITSDISMNFLVDTLKANVDNPQYEIKIQANKKIVENIQIDLKLSSFDNIFYPAQFATSPTGEGTIVSVSMNAGDSMSYISIMLDTAQLNTEQEKSFTITIENNGNYLIGDVDQLFFSLAGFEEVITANKPFNFKSLQIKQNPVQDYLYLINPLHEIQYSIIDNRGKIIQQSVLSSVERIDVSNLNTGLYFLIIRQNKDAYIFRNKFYKK